MPKISEVTASKKKNQLKTYLGERSNLKDWRCCEIDCLRQNLWLFGISHISDYSKSVGNGFYWFACSCMCSSVPLGWGKDMIVGCSKSWPFLFFSFFFFFFLLLLFLLFFWKAPTVRSDKKQKQEKKSLGKSCLAVQEKPKVSIGGELCNR